MSLTAQVFRLIGIIWFGCLLNYGALVLNKLRNNNEKKKKEKKEKMIKQRQWQQKKWNRTMIEKKEKKQTHQLTLFAQIQCHRNTLFDNVSQLDFAVEWTAITKRLWLSLLTFIISLHATNYDAKWMRSDKSSHQHQNLFQVQKLFIYTNGFSAFLPVQNVGQSLPKIHFSNRILMISD